MAFLFTAMAYVILPVVTLYTNLAAIYLLDFRDPEFWYWLAFWAPGVFLYYIYIGQLIIGQRLPFLDRIWGFPNLIRKHRGLFGQLFLITMVLHTLVHLQKDGLEKLVFQPDSGMIVVYMSVIGSIVLMVLAVKVWLKPQRDKMQKVADYVRMHRIHQLFYLLAVGVWYHVVTSGAFQENFAGTVLVTGYLLFALLCKLYMFIAGQRAPIYRLEKLEQLHENFVRLRLRATGVGPRQEALHQHRGGQYAYFSFALKDKKRRTYWEQHPFSFAGFASQDSAEDASLLTVVVKKLGDFTTRLPEMSVEKVKVLGPYGRFTCETGEAILIAAGIGITPFLSMLEQRAARGGGQPPLALHWFVQDASELVFEDRFEYFRKKLPNASIQTYVGQLLTENVLEQVLSCLPAGPRLGVLYCGPPVVGPLVRKVIDKIGIPRRNFHTELFSM